MSKYINTPAYPDKMPVDISFVFADEKPAGKHGFCKAVGDEFRYEDGTLARWWGVNFNGGACFLEHEDADKVARRIAQSGCNIVRFHQLDAEWDTPNLYSFTKGPHVTTSRVLDPISMDRLDYLISALKKEGIYCYMDMMTYRKFKAGDDVPFACELEDSAKPYSIFDRRMIELQKEFCDQFWNHYNPYTGLLHKDDPVFVMTEITNECDLWRNKPATRVEYYENQLVELFKAWLEKNGIEYDFTDFDRADNTPELEKFRIELTESYYREMYDYMRSIGVKIPITGTNWPFKTPGITVSEREMDFVDSHHYYYEWRWGETEKCSSHVQINGYPTIITNPAYQRLNNKPFFISEWDMPWPNCYRAEGPIYYAAISALQNWSGMTIHTYSYCAKQRENSILGKEIDSSTIGGTPYREGIFSVWNDPAKFGLFYHSALMVRRCDVKPLDKKIGVRITNEQKAITKAYATGLEIHRLATVLDDETGCDAIINDTDAIEQEDPNLIVSDNGQMWRDLKNKVAGINTDRTKIIYGRLNTGKGKGAKAMEQTNMDGLKVVGKTDFGVVALSSLTNDPTEKSDNMLLTTIGRASNTDAVWDGDKMLDFGKAPIRSEVIQATISIKTDRTDLKVWGVSPDGYFVGKRKATFEDGYMTFEIGDKLPASYYLIFSE